MSTLEVTRARLGSEGFEGSDFVTSWHRKSFNFFTLGFLISTIMFEVPDDRSSQPCSSVSSLNLTLLPPHPEALESTAVPPLVSRWCNCPIHTQDLRMARKAGGSGRPPADRPKDSVCGKAHLHVPN